MSYLISVANYLKNTFYRTLDELEHYFLNMERLFVIELEHPFFTWNDRTSNFKLNRALTRFTKSLIELTQTSFF